MALCLSEFELVLDTFFFPFGGIPLFFFKNSKFKPPLNVRTFSSFKTLYSHVIVQPTTFSIDSCCLTDRYRSCMKIGPRSHRSQMWWTQLGGYSHSEQSRTEKCTPLDTKRNVGDLLRELRRSPGEAFQCTVSISYYTSGCRALSLSVPTLVSYMILYHV